MFIFFVEIMLFMFCRDFFLRSVVIEVNIVDGF